RRRAQARAYAAGQLERFGVPAACHDLHRLLGELKGEGVALVVIEHHMELIMAVADRICVLNLGRPLACGAPAAIQNDPRVLQAYLGSAQ
ncbi:ABC transporter ATP-binding protein C-terminal domain-containing protein, partial [Bordetella pertussis]